MLKYIQEQRKTMYRVSHNFDVQGVPKKTLAKNFYQFYEKNNLVNSGAPAFRPQLHLLPQEMRAEPNLIMTSAGSACRANLIITSAGNACRA